jgi:hypothetical protein
MKTSMKHSKNLIKFIFKFKTSFNQLKKPKIKLNKKTMEPQFVFFWLDEKF